MNDRLLSLLGLCRRAGKIVIGADPVIDSVLNGKSYVVLMAKDFSHNSKKSVEKACNTGNVEAKVISRTKEELSLAIGKFCAVVAITDRALSAKIQELILKEQEQEE